MSGRPQAGEEPIESLAQFRPGRARIGGARDGEACLGEHRDDKPG